MEREKAASTKPLTPMLADMDFAPGCTGQAGPCWRTATVRVTVRCPADADHSAVLLLCPDHALALQQELEVARLEHVVVCTACYQQGRAIPRLVAWDDL